MDMLNVNVASQDASASTEEAKQEVVAEAAEVRPQQLEAPQQSPAQEKSEQQLMSDNEVVSPTLASVTDMGDVNVVMQDPETKPEAEEPVEAQESQDRSQQQSDENGGDADEAQVADDGDGNADQL